MTTADTTADPVPRPPRRGGRSLGAVTGVGVLVAAGVWMATLTGDEHDVRAASFTGVREIVVEVDRGSVSLARAPGPVSDVTVTREWRSVEPRATTDVVDGVLRIAADCEDDPCSTAHDVTVPDGVPVRVGIGSGSVDATGLTVPALDARVTTGSITATFATPPDRVGLRVEVGSVSVGVPPADYDVDARVAGVSSIGIPDVPGAARSLDVDAGAGSVQINGTG